MDKLAEFESKFGKARTRWTKAQWRTVALTLAGVELLETRGRKKATPAKVHGKDQNLKLAEFWRDQEREFETVDSKTEAGDVRPRRRKLTKSEATTAIVKQAYEGSDEPMPNGFNLRRKGAALHRAIQGNSKKSRKE